MARGEDVGLPVHTRTFSMSWSFSLTERGGDQPGRDTPREPDDLDGGGGDADAPRADDEAVGRLSIYVFSF